MEAQSAELCVFLASNRIDYQIAVTLNQAGGRIKTRLSFNGAWNELKKIGPDCFQCVNVYRTTTLGLYLCIPPLFRRSFIQPPYNKPKMV